MCDQQRRLGTIVTRQRVNHTCELNERQTQTQMRGRCFKSNPKRRISGRIERINNNSNMEQSVIALQETMYLSTMKRH